MNNPSSKLLPFDTNILPESGEIMVLDTSFVVEMWGYSENPDLQREGQEFINKLASQGIIVATTIKTHEELRILVASREVHRNKEKRKKILNNGTISISDVLFKVECIEKGLKSLSNYYPEPIGIINSELLNKADSYMRNYNIEYADAMIYAICKSENINHIVTLDGDYYKIKDGSLFVYMDKNKYNQIVSNNQTITSTG